MCATLLQKFKIFEETVSIKNVIFRKSRDLIYYFESKTPIHEKIINFTIKL